MIEKKPTTKRHVRFLAPGKTAISFVPVWNRQFPTLLSLEYYRVEQTLWPAHIFEGGWKRVYECPIEGGTCPFALVAFRSAGPKGYTVYERGLHEHKKTGNAAGKAIKMEAGEPTRRKRREKTDEEKMVEVSNGFWPS